jgi:hypothetical protein
MSRNRLFFPGSNITYFTFLSICDIFTVSPSYNLRLAEPQLTGNFCSQIRVKFTLGNTNIQIGRDGKIINGWKEMRIIIPYSDRVSRCKKNVEISMDIVFLASQRKLE